MAYDHHRKAGNQGDCVKHPPLIAALDEVLRNTSHAQRLFHYLDVFAGHAWHPLLDGDEYEWKNGIGKLAPFILPSHAPDSVKCWWGMWHGAPDWPTTTPPGYPGSSWIAALRCRNAQRHVKLELSDRCEEVRRDLERAFPNPHAIQDAIPDIWLIGQSLDPAQGKQAHIEEADLVFIDPPGWQSTDQPSYPEWKDIFEQVLKPRGDKERSTLMWMPAGGQGRTKNKKDSSRENSGAYPWDKGSQGDQREKCDELTGVGYSWTAVRWRKFSKNSGCILVYNCAREEIRAAVNSIVEIAGNGWEKKHSSG